MNVIVVYNQISAQILDPSSIVSYNSRFVGLNWHGFHPPKTMRMVWWRWTPISILWTVGFSSFSTHFGLSISMVHRVIGKMRWKLKPSICTCIRKSVKFFKKVSWFKGLCLDSIWFFLKQQFHIKKRKSSKFEQIERTFKKIMTILLENFSAQCNIE